jgi:uncharacterized protein (TIGR03083 family)
MISQTTPVEAIATIEHDEAMHLARVECDRLLALVDSLRDDDWSRPTDCVDWDVRAMLGHLLGMFKLQADPEERARQVRLATETAARTGGLRLDALTALQVQEHSSLAPEALRIALRDAASRGLHARSATTAVQRAATYEPQLPGESSWTVGYLFDIVHTRDPWIHRVDICRATGHVMVLTPDHDGRIVADVVAEWARRHGRPFQLTLGGEAGGRFAVGSYGVQLDLDAVEFCRILSGRSRGAGLLATRVPF